MIEFIQDRTKWTCKYWLLEFYEQRKDTLYIYAATCNRVHKPIEKIRVDIREYITLVKCNTVLCIQWTYS
jgi:hypothetical protein